MPFFYRFRSVKALLGDRQELENQEIYFSPPEDLNDPIEGFKDLFWHGDAIVWRNLLRHYLLCLTRTYIHAMVLGKEYQPAISKGFVFATERAFPNPQFQALYQRICAAFFSAHGLDALPSLLAASPHAFRRDDLEFCLRGVHAVALNSIVTILRENNVIPHATGSPAPPAFSEESVVEGVKRVFAAIAAGEGIDPKALHLWFLAIGHLFKQEDLIRYLTANDDFSRAWHSIFYSFPEQYVDQLKDLVFFDWYVACFVADPNQAAMWGNYGDGHKGVCLKFRANDAADGAPSMTLHGIIGWHGGSQDSGRTYGDRVFRFDKMNYVDKFATIDFFRSIGRVQMGALKADWYTDASGNVSPCADGVFSTTEEWHRKYWAAFQAMVTMKLSDWEHESEHRLVLFATLGGFSDPTDRKLTYRFSDLEGIIFGIKTPLEDKKRIVNLIRAKCKAAEREAFAFGQATYVPQTGEIVTMLLDLLRVE